jgi:hypothetical protein
MDLTIPGEPPSISGRPPTPKTGPGPPNSNARINY